MARLSKKSVVWKWIISYICIILISAISSLITYNRSQNIIKERQEKINEVVLEQASKQIQDCIVLLEKLREEILINASFNSLNKSKLDRYTSTTYKQYLLYSDLNTYLKLNNSYSHIMLYFKSDDKIVSDSTVNYSSPYWEIYNTTLGISFDEWTSLINGTYNSFHATNVKMDNSESTIFCRTIQTEQLGRQKVNLFVVFTKEDWAKLLAEYQYYKDTSMLILDQFGKAAVKFDNASIITGYEDEQKIIEAIRAGKKEITLRNNEVIKLYYLQNNSPYFLCILTPESVYLETIHNFQLIFSFIFIISFAFSIVLIILFVKNNYKPVRDLLKILLSTGIFQSTEHKEQPSIEDENEFTIVKKGVVQVSSSYNSVKMELHRQNKLLRKVYLSRLLQGKTKLLPEEQLKELYGLHFKYTDFVVILLYVQDFNSNRDNNYDADHSPTEIVDLDHAQLIMVDRYNELITDMGWTVNYTKIDDILVLIVCFPPEDNSVSLLGTIIRKGMEGIENSYGIESLVSVSGKHYNIEKLSVAYQEALQAFEAIKLYDLGNYVNYSDISELFSSSYNYPYEMEQKLIKAIQLGDYSNAESIFSEVIHSNIINKKYISHDIIRCLMFDLLGTVMKTFDTKKESQQFIKQLKPAKRLSECSDLQSMKKIFKEILSCCCEFFRVGIDKDENLCYKIQAYIRDNFWDSNLCVTSIAEHFSMSPVALSKIFREITGTKISLLLSEIRVKKSKELLLLSNTNLAYIASKVGFGSTKTFTRAFKQIEGCTPGQWRENQKCIG
ncbi:MAG: helix-turn-helix transcriptional regulator [Clostridiaceae bacterium]|nr:helix-turn-helix transcriptional regulator [Clostridiaceae bacterium]